ncbi:MAG: ADP-dependent glucokinase/phosphofructokinase [Candidatus Helarchaeota archaeon]
MIAAIWNQRLITAVERARLAHNVFCAYNANIDAKEYINAQKIHLAFLQNPNLLNEVKEKVKNPPDEIRTPADFFAGLYLAMKEGKSLQWEIREKNKEMLEWFDLYFEKPDEMRMGGQTGIISNLLSILGVESIVYLPMLSKRQAEMFRQERIFFPININGKVDFVQIHDAYNEDDDTKINWVFEFREDGKFPVPIEDNKIISAPRTNRFIVASRPPGLIPICDEKVEEILDQIGERVDRAIISGYQHLKEVYSDGKTCEDYLDLIVKHLLMFKSKNPTLRVHMEFAGIPNEVIRRNILLKISPQINSIGLNEVEILMALKILECDDEIKLIKQNENSYTLYLGLLKMAELLGLERIHLHNLGYHLLYLNKCYPTSAYAARNALLYASNIGATRALMGDFYSRKPVHYEIEIGKSVSISYTGLKELEFFADKMLEKGVKFDKEKFMDEGIMEFERYYIIIAPAQIAPYPQSTVGIGDSVSASAFVADEAKDPHGESKQHCVSPQIEEL